MAPAAALIATTAASVVSAALFLPKQSIWVDEVTQMSGLTLSPVEVVRWLVDARRHDFGVPGDRMPPLSYWLGSAWAHLFGRTVLSLRWFGVVCTAAAVALLFRAANRLFGLRAAIFAAAFLALSPNVCVLAVEIRAYPLFLLTSAGALEALSAVVADPEPGGTNGAWARLTAWLAAACATHFFGMVLSGAVLFGLALFFGPGQRKRLAAVAGAIGLVGVALIPLVRGSVAVSLPVAEQTNRGHEIAQLLYRQIAHPAMNALPVIIPIAFGAAVMLAAFVVGARRTAEVNLLVASLAAGLAVTIAAAFVVHGFSAAKTTYATWALPLVSLVLAVGAAAHLRRGGAMPVACGVTFLAAEILASGQLWRHGDHFSHGPMNKITEMVDRVGPQETAVIHVDSLEYAAAYFPLRYLYGPTFPQYVVGTSAPLGRPLNLAQEGWAARLSGVRHLLLIRSKQETGAELGAQIRGGDRPFDPDPIVSWLTADPEWRVQDHQEVLSFVAADLTLLEREGAP